MSLPAPPVRVVLIGSESTGKTTLARQLAEALTAAWVPEYSRAYALERGALPLGAADVESIARGQIAQEDAALALARARVMILDTDLISTTVYAEHYYGPCPAWVLQAARDRLADLYLVCDIDLPWIADDVRDQPGAREIIQSRMKARLAEFGARFAEVNGVGSARLQRALAIIQTVVESPRRF